MTFEQIFAGRIVLMRTQRHIAQKRLHLDHEGKPYVMFSGVPYFTKKSDEQAFLIVERLLVELESEFDLKKRSCDRRKQRRLNIRADRQVTR